MKRLLEIPEYVEDVRRVAALDVPWSMLSRKTLLLTGGTGLIGSFLVDVLAASNSGCRIILLGRSEEKARSRFLEYWNQDWLQFVKWNVSGGASLGIDGNIDFVLHLASNTHPLAYATDPIGTIETNVVALHNLLSFASDKHAERFLFASSNEIYGENRGDVEFFDEKYCGYIDCNTLRAGYPESKRCGEALCQAYIKQKQLDCVIARLTRTYGPTILPSDTKAISQFFNNALRHEDIVLKSDGKQHYSYQYVADSVSGLITVLLKGETGRAYNIADATGDITLRELASCIAAQVRRRIVFEIPNELESSGFSKATKARLDGSALRQLGWKPFYDIQSGVARTFSCLVKKGL